MSRWRAPLCGQLATLALTLAYCLHVGPVGFYWDTHTYLDRARHLAFCGTLDMDNHPTSMAPPLYSILIAPAYWLAKSPDGILQAIVLINAVLFATSFLPLYGLLRRYSHLPRGPAAAWATIAAVGPYAVTYAPILFTEAAFFPLLYACFYVLARAAARPYVHRFALLGLALGIACLARDAGRSVALALAVVALAHVARQALRLRRNGRLPVAPRRASLRIRLTAAGRTALHYTLAGGCAFGLVIGWLWFQAQFVHVNRGADDLGAPLRRMLRDPADLQLHLLWLANCGAYLLFAPLSLLPLLTLALATRYPRMLVRDPVLLWLLLSMLISAAIAVTLMSSIWGGAALTWNRYVVPLIGLWFPVALRYRALLAAPLRTVSAAAALLLLVLLGNPARLACHFPDALLLFMSEAHPQTSPLLLNGIFAAVLLVTALPLLLTGRRAQWCAVAGVALVYSAAGVECARFWRKSPHNLSDYRGVAHTLFSEMHAANADPWPCRRGGTVTAAAPRVYYDPETVQIDLFALGRAIAVYPGFAQPLALPALYQQVAAGEAPAFYLSHRPLLVAERLAQDRDTLVLSRLTPKGARALAGLPEPLFHELQAAGAPPPGFVAAPPAGAPVGIHAVRTGPKLKFEPYGDGHAVWLAPHAEGGLILYVAADRAGVVTLAVDVALIGPAAPQPCPLQVRLLADPGTPGENPAPAAPVVELNAPGVARFGLALAPGVNRVELTVPAPAGPGRAGADPRELMLFVRTLAFE